MLDLSARTDVTEFKFYHYHPSIAATVIFIVAFFASSCWHSWQVWRSRCWLMVPLLLGGLLEVIGYCGRAASGAESPDWTLGPYIIQAILLLVAPALFAATIYIEFGQLIVLLGGERYSVIPVKWMTKIFVAGDVVSFLMQSAGGGIQSSGSASSLTMGANIITGRLFVQIAFFGFFILVAAIFNARARKHMTNAEVLPRWQRHMAMLFAASTLIMIRSIVRVVEYLQGFSGYILSREWYLYIFDALLMLGVMVLFNVLHPGRILNLREGGSKEQPGSNVPMMPRQGPWV